MGMIAGFEHGGNMVCGCIWA